MALPASPADGTAVHRPARRGKGGGCPLGVSKSMILVVSRGDLGVSKNLRPGFLSRIWKLELPLEERGRGAARDKKEDSVESGV